MSTARSKHATLVLPGLRHPRVVAQLESVVVRECEKGGTAASIKAAMDRAIEQLHKGTGPTRDRAAEIVARTADRLGRKN